MKLGTQGTYFSFDESRCVVIRNRTHLLVWAVDTDSWVRHPLIKYCPCCKGHETNWGELWWVTKHTPAMSLTLLWSTYASLLNQSGVMWLQVTSLANFMLEDSEHLWSPLAKLLQHWTKMFSQYQLADGLGMLTADSLMVLLIHAPSEWGSIPTYLLWNLLAFL